MMIPTHKQPVNKLVVTFDIKNLDLVQELCKIISSYKEDCPDGMIKELELLIEETPSGS